MLCKKNKFKKIVEKKRATKARDDLPVVNCLLLCMALLSCSPKQHEASDRNQGINYPEMSQRKIISG